MLHRKYADIYQETCKMYIKYKRERDFHPIIYDFNADRCVSYKL